MRNTILSFSLCLIAVPALAEDRRYGVDGFINIDVTNGIAVEIVTGQDFAVSAHAKRGDLDRLVIKRVGDTLEIDRKVSWGWFGKGKKDRFEVTVAMPDLEAIMVHGGSAAELDAAAIDGIEAEATGGSSLTVDGLAGGLALLTAAGGSHLAIDGSCTELEARASGGSRVNAKRLYCVDAALKADSGSHLNASASDVAQVKATGGSSIRLSGSAEVTASDVSSGSSFKH